MSSVTQFGGTGSLFRAFCLILTVLHFTTPTASSEAPHAHKQCYHPSGGIAPGGPCFPDQPNPQCCGFGWTCTSNGLCKTGPSNEKNFKSQYYRPSCTDQSWNSTHCAQFCRTSDDNIDAIQGLQVCDAAAGSFCCQRDFDCCKNSSLILTLGSASAVTTIVRPTTTPLDTPPKNAKAEYTKDTVIGMVAGFSIAAVIFVMGGAFWVYRKRRLARRKNTNALLDDAKELDAVDTGLPKPQTVTTEYVQGDSANPIELEATSGRSELDSLPSRSDQWGDSVSPISEVGTLVTNIRLELEAPFKGQS